MSERCTLLLWSILCLIGTVGVEYKVWMEADIQTFIIANLFLLIPGIVMSLYGLFKSIQSYWNDPFGEEV